MTGYARKGRIWLTILGGFLGAGKSTWLRHCLHHNLLPGTMVVVNEAADMPVDHALLVGSINLRILAGGCACCKKRTDFLELLLQICDDRIGGNPSTPKIDRVVLETSGLADPGRILDSIVKNPVLQHHVVVDEIVVIVDALHGLSQIRDEDLGRRQIEAADRLVVTKADAAEPERLCRLIATLKVLNPRATFSGAIMGSPVDLPDTSGTDPDSLPAVASTTTAPIGTVTLDLGEPIDWAALTVWLSALIHARGDDIIRIKGTVRTPRGRLLLQSVRKVVQSPEILPDESQSANTRGSSLVLIGRRFTADALARSLTAFGIENALAIEAKVQAL